MKKYSLILSLLISLLLFGALSAVASPGDFLFEFGDDYRLANPRSVAVDGSGNVYVADTSNHRIDVFTSTGTFVRKWGDNGSGNGQFSYPSGIAVDGSGNVYVADMGNHRIQVFTSTGTFVRKWGASGTGDGQFNSPYGVAVDGSGSVYVADTSNHRIQVFTTTGTFVRKWGASGTGDGQLNSPYGIAVDGSGSVYVADTSNHRIQVFTITGTFVRKWGASGTGDGQFSFPRGIAVDGSGNICVADTSNNRIQVFTGTGAFVRKWGASGSGDGQFSTPYGIAADGSGNVYVADTSNHRVQVFTGTATFLRKWGASGSAEGQFNTPYGITMGGGNAYVADTNNHRAQVFTDTGAFVRKWGASGSGDGQFIFPGGMAVDGSGNVYVADTSNHRIQVFTTTGTFVRKWGAYGTGVGQFNSPGGIAVDGSGNVYVADTYNHRIQVFTGTGTLVAVWGGLGTGNGQFNLPRGIAVDESGNVYVADTNNNRIQVFTGTGGVFLMKWGISGTGDGQLTYPYGIAVDGNGNAYVADTNNHRIQAFTTTGTFLRKWGVYGAGEGQFKYPRGIAVDENGNVYVADTSNHRIQVFEGLVLTDIVAPTTMLSMSGTSGNNGWYISDVQISLTAMDAAGGSGVNNTEYSFDGTNWNTYTGPFTISTEGMTTVYYGSIDNAGNIEAAKSQTIRIDKTLPTSSGSALPAPNANGWNNTNVTVSFSGTDTVSGIDTCTNITLNNDGTGQSAVGTCTDKAGNISVTATVSGLNIDKTPPTISGSALPAPNANGWNNTNVTVNFTGSDSLSGIDTCTNAITLSNEGSGQPAGGTCTDKAGNISVTPLTISIDKTPPTISGSALPAPNARGWNNSNVTVSFSGTDGLSGIDSCTGAVTLSGEGAGQSTGGTCADKAGNISVTSLAISIDKTPPTISGSALPAPNANGWNKTNVTVSFSGTDALSGIDTCANITLNNDGTGQSAAGNCTDRAGNVSVTATVSGLNIDKTPPTISASALPAPNANGWNNTDVTVSFSGTDSLSGIDTCTDAIILSNDGADQGAGGTCTDRAGNVSVTPLTLNIDKTPPTVSGSALPVPNANGWNSTAVTVSFSGADLLSGIDTCTDAIILSNDGAGQSANGICTDKAGNTSATATVSGINIDSTLIGPGDFLFEFGDDYRLANPRSVAVDGSGNVYVADTSNHRIDVFTSTGTFVRKWGDNGSGNGQFSYPSGIAVDGSGNVYVADMGNHRIQVFTSTGTFVRKWGASGTGDGQFNSPYGVAVDGSGSVYVADTSNHRIQVFTTTGIFVRKWGASGSGDGQFNSPYGVAVDGSGSVYVADTSNHRIDVFTSTGTFVRKWGASGTGDGQFSFPRGIAVDGSGNICVADTSNNRIQVFTGTGAFVRKWGASGSGDGQFSTPYGIAADGSGNVYVADTSNHRVQVFTGTATFLRKWGASGSAEGQFNTPYGIAMGGGNAYVADANNHRAQVFTDTGAFVRKWGASGSGDGQFIFPGGIAVDGSGNVYVADTSNHRIQVFTTTGTFVRKWGAYGTGVGQFNSPGGIAVDGSGNVYVADTYNHRIQVFTGTGTLVAVWGGLGTGNGQFNLPRGIAVDESGNVYAADTNNNRIQVFTGTGGVFLMKWGISGTGDGQLTYPYGIAVDGNGNAYVADTNNHRIQAFTITGTFLRKWGVYGAGEGQFKYPRGIAVDENGNVYVADTNNHRIQVFEGEGGPGPVPTDSAAPTTMLSISGTSGNNGWYISDVQVSLTPAEEVDGSGINNTEYSFDGTNWNTYTGPFTISTEGMTTVYYRSTDNAGNIEAAKSQTIRIDKTLPTSSGSALPAPNANGWNNTNVTVSFSGTDTVSGIDTCTNAVILSNDGANQSAGGTCTDRAGNVSVTATVSGLNIDKTPPTISGSALPAPNANGWNNTDVTVSFIGTDALSGIDTCAGSAILSGEGANQSAGGACTDKAGNVSVTAAVSGLNIDKTPPTISGSALPAPNANGWNNTDVTVSFSGTDTLSGIDICTNITLNNDGTGQSAAGNCTDKAGNISVTATVSGLNIDKTPPTISGSALPAPNANGWNNTDVTVSFTGTDALSGIDICTGTATLSGEGANQSAGGTCTDKAGNVSVTAAVSGLNIDKTPPTISALPAPNANGWNNTDVTVSFSGTDALSGIDICTGTATLSGEGANQSAGGTCTDKAGNVSVTAAVSGINIDKTPPTISGSALPAPNANGWNSTNVTVSYTGTDALSGIDTCTNPVILSNDGANQSAGGACTDKAGNVSVTAMVSGLNIDKTPPAILADALPAPNSFGWNNTNVIVSFSGTDALSGIASCTGAVTVSGEGADQSAGGTCTDRAGNTGVATLAVNIDKTPPTVSGSALPAPNPNGWNDTDITVSFTGTDALSGIDTCTDAITLSNEGSGQSASGTCTDKAGNNSVTATVSGINIDKPSPTGGPGNGVPVANAGDDITISYSQAGSTTVQGTVTDADSAYTFTYRWTETDESGDVLSILQDWTPAGPEGGCPLYLGALSLGIGTHHLTLEANDGEATSLDNMTLTINNSVPNANAGNDITVTTEEVAATVIQGIATDFDGDALTCRWMKGITVLQDSPAGPGGECALSLSGLALGIGTHTLTLSAGDGSAISSDDMVLTINNTPPVANAGENIVMASDLIAATVIQGTATDFDGNALTCRWMEGTSVLKDWAPAGPNGECPLSLSAFALTLDRGTHSMTLEVNDGQATSSNTMILTINNSAPHAAPGGAGIYEINTPAILPGDVSDFDGDLVHYEWTDGTNVLCSGDIQSVAGGTSVLLPDCVVSNLGLGTHTISLQVSDGFNLTDTKNVTIQIVDNGAPKLKPVANKYILWPPDHRMVDIYIAANASDASGCPLVLAATVKSDEPEYGLRGGDIGPDWTQPVINQGTGMISMKLRAERSGRQDGRIYTVTITAKDCSGNVSTAKVKIRVPHDKDNEEREREDREERERNDRDGHDGDCHDGDGHDRDD